jgi:glycosyltransferase involved in cell wall biosynthesis
MIGWARLPQGPAEGGGLNQVVTQLSEELVKRGHRVVYLRSGMDHSLRSGMRIQREGDWRGVECFNLINSPNLSGCYNFENVQHQIASPQQSRLVARFLKEQNVDVLHIHVFEGMAFDLVETVHREAGIPVVVTPHNYVALCPQLDLMHQERSVCDDYDGGRRCVDCLRVPDFRWEAARRARVHSARRVLGSPLYDAIKPLGVRLVAAASRLLPKGSGRRQFEAPAPPGTGFKEDLGPGQPPAHERLVSSTDRHLVVLNDYGRRRLAGIAALNHADRILAPGRFLARVHQAMGVDPSRLRHVPLGLAHIDDLRQRTSQAADFENEPWRAGHAKPLRLVYFGNCWVNKGLGILVDAMLALDEATRRRVELDIYASGDDRSFRDRLGARTNIRFHGSYSAKDQARALDAADVGVFAGIALENSPLVILEMLAAGRFVIASRRGAMEDFILEGRNGSFFPPGDFAALAAAIEKIVKGELLLPTRREAQEASPRRTLGEYVDQMQDVYVEVRAEVRPAVLSGRSPN